MVISNSKCHAPWSMKFWPPNRFDLTTTLPICKSGGYYPGVIKSLRLKCSRTSQTFDVDPHVSLYGVNEMVLMRGRFRVDRAVGADTPFPGVLKTATLWFGLGDHGVYSLTADLARSTHLSISSGGKSTDPHQPLPNRLSTPPPFFTREPEA